MVNINIYRTTFSRECPTVPTWVTYTLEIHSKTTIMVEDIGKVVHQTAPCFHEVLADVLFEKFGGHQVMTGHHHGVDIKTIRGEMVV